MPHDAIRAAAWGKLGIYGYYAASVENVTFNKRYIMKTVSLMEFDKDTRLFRFFKEVKLLAVPTSGDKVIIDIDGIGYVFKVYDVHYGDNGMTEINAIRQSTIADYYSSSFPDII